MSWKILISNKTNPTKCHQQLHHSPLWPACRTDCVSHCQLQLWPYFKLHGLYVFFSSSLSDLLFSNNLRLAPRVTTPTYYTGVFGYSIYSQYISSTAMFLNNILSLATAQNLNYNFTSFQSSVPPTAKGCKGNKHAKQFKPNTNQWQRLWR